ncbi:MAG: glycosyltransferase family 39 protein [Chloroflexota bacterium]|nr:glycosyltransferase family 39 protein [Chloroflexota bacterium]
MLIRVPYLWQIPRFTDELQEGLWALAIYRGEIRPLTAVDSYYGPLWSYLLAGVFHLGGPTELLPRLVAMLLAALGVVLTYLVGRDMAGRSAGLIAAALMLTSAGHVVINSHTARSNSITPLITTLIVWTLYRAVRSGNGWYLAIAGLLFGLALQTHLSVVVFVPGLAVGLLLMRPRLLVSRWVPLSAALFALGYANMIVFNLQSGFWSFVHARALQSGYADGRSTSLSIYLENFDALIQSLSRLLSGNIDTAESLARFPYVALALIGLVVLARRGNPLPLAFCLSGVLLFPYFNPRYGPILSGRYLIPLLPFAYLGIGLALAWLAEQLRTRRLVVPRAAQAAVVLALVLAPLVHLGLYYREVIEDERVNEPLFTLVDTLRSARQAGELVLLDEGLGQENLTAGGTDLKALRFLLEASAIPYQVAKLTSAGVEPIMADAPNILTIMDVKKTESLGRKLTLTPYGGAVESASGSSHRYRVYRLSPRP